MTHIKMRELQVFSAVLKTGAATRAGNLVGLSQPAVSAMIAGLEAELGFQLFNRVRGRLQPTVEAGYFYDAVRKLVDDFENLGQVARNIREANIGNIRIVANHVISQHLLPRVIARFREMRPEVEIVIQTQSSHNVREWLHAQHYDIGVAELPVFQHSVEVEEVVLPCVCIMTSDCPLSRLSVISPGDLRDYPIILNNRDHMVTFQINKAFSEAGLDPYVRVEAELTGVACAIAEQGAGIAVVDLLTASHFAKRGMVSRPFDPEITLNLAIMLPELRPRSIAMQLFLTILKEEVSSVLKDQSLYRGASRSP